MNALPAIAAITLVFSFGAQGRPPQPRQVEVRDGDTILMDSTARVHVVRRSAGTARIVYHKVQRWAVLMVDSAGPNGAGPDGRVDAVFNFNDVNGEWPFGERWEGMASIDEHLAIGEFGPAGISLITPIGSVQLLSDRGSQFRDKAVSNMLFYASGGRSSGGNVTFDQAETQWTALAARSAERRMSGTGVTGGVVGGFVNGMPAPSTSAYPPPQAPVRVGGNIKTPQKLHDVAPVMPDVARQAGIRGVVILEIVIAEDGTVRDAKVLRSVLPPVDAAAIDAVKQWRYEVTSLNGAPVPVIMTVTVNFP
jgi:TonB family protein